MSKFLEPVYPPCMLQYIGWDCCQVFKKKMLQWDRHRGIYRERDKIRATIRSISYTAMLHAHGSKSINKLKVNYPQVFIVKINLSVALLLKGVLHQHLRWKQQHRKRNFDKLVTVSDGALYFICWKSAQSWMHHYF